MSTSKYLPRRYRCAAATVVASVALVVSVQSNPGLGAAEDLSLVSPESVGMSSERLGRISTYIQGYIDRDQIAGAITLVARKGKVVHFEAQGWRHKEENVSMTNDTIFELASMTKPIVSAALMMLFEEGRFRLDDPISNWLPEYTDHKVRLTGYGGNRTVTESRPITMRHVLTHTSGLTMNPNGRGLSQEERGRTTNNGDGFGTMLEHVKAAAVIPAFFHPGDEWRYGDSTNYVAALVESISGMTLGAFLQERIFDPLGMTDTHYYVPWAKTSQVSALYGSAEDNTITLTRAPAFFEPSRYFQGVAGLKSTTADYYRFAQMFANGGELDGVRLLGRMTVNNMITNQTGALPIEPRGPGYGFGLGFGIVTNPAKTADALSIGSYTWGGAFGTLYWADPVEDLIGLLMIQLAPWTPMWYEIRPLFSNVVTQAVVDSLADQRPRIMGHATPF
jgi:CubicO group peptidase (beta-lactamase class C family)